MNLASESIDSLRRGWFARAWAVATWFHLAAQPREALITQPTLALLSVLLGLAAVWTLLKPGNIRALLMLCALVMLHAWAEAPVIGNHWVLAALVSLTFCLSYLYTTLRLGSAAGAREFTLAARLTVLTAYSFAAFAKLNTDFLDPAVSCAVLFQDQMARSWGLPGLSVVGNPALGQLLAVVTAGIELAVAALLAFPRTRRAGLALAFAFHWGLPLDLNQHFWDFSSVLFAGFLLFLDREQVAWLRERGQALLSGVGRPRPALVMALTVLTGVTMSVLNILPLSLGYAETLQQVGHSLWWVYGTALLALVILACFAPRPQRASRRRRLPLLLLVGPGLAAFNGLTPYLELKTGFGWNMYSNLRTVAGQTNHLLLPGTLDLTHAQRDLVTVQSSPDPVLQRLHDQDYGLTLSEFRNYAHRFPESIVTYRWQGRIYHAPRLGDDPLVQGQVNVLAQKLISFRVVDLRVAQRCQPAFTPAR